MKVISSGEMSALILNADDIQNAIIEYYKSFDGDKYKQFNFESIYVRPTIEILVVER